MATHCVCLQNNPHQVTFEQREEIERITLGTPEERFIDGIDKEVYYRATYDECLLYKNSNEILRTEFVILEIPNL